MITYSVKMINAIIWGFCSVIPKGKTDPVIDVKKAEDWKESEELKGNKFPKGSFTVHGFVGTKNTVNMNEAMTKVQSGTLDLFKAHLDYVKGTKGYSLDSEGNLIEHTMLRRVKKAEKNIDKKLYNTIMANIKKPNKTNNKTSNK